MIDIVDGRQLVGCLDPALERARSAGLPVSLAYGDIDRMRRITESRGHVIGDAVVEDIPSFVGSMTRPDDVIGRYEGDEIVVLLVGADVHDALRWTEGVRTALEEHRPPHLPHPMTVSWGVACHDGRESADELLGRADQAMQRAKRAGMNQVERAWEVEPLP